MRACESRRESLLWEAVQYLPFKVVIVFSNNFQIKAGRTLTEKLTRKLIFWLQRIFHLATSWSYVNRKEKKAMMKNERPPPKKTSKKIKIMMIMTTTTIMMTIIIAMKTLCVQIIIIIMIIKDSHKLLWDFSIQTDHLIPARRPDLTIINKTKENL